MLSHPAVTELLVISFLVVLLVGGLVGLAIGAGLLTHGAAMIALFARLNRWVSTRKALRPLEMSVPTEEAVSGQRRWVAGTLFAVGGGYAAFILAWRVDVLRSGAVLGIHGVQQPVAVLLLDVLRWCLFAGCVAAVFTGVTMTFFPRAWSAIEAWSNRWYSTRQLALGGDDMHMTLDRWVEMFPRRAGAVITAASLIPVVTSAVLLFSLP
jgi:hypothetical protein